MDIPRRIGQAVRRVCWTYNTKKLGPRQGRTEKVFWGGETQPLRAAHGAPLAMREPARGHGNVANVGMLPMANVANYQWGACVRARPSYSRRQDGGSPCGGRAGARPSRWEYGRNKLPGARQGQNVVRRGEGRVERAAKAALRAAVVNAGRSASVQTRATSSRLCASELRVTA